jgi:hypothetical protein
MTTCTVHDPFTGKDVQVSNRLTDRLRGKYAVGPVQPNGEPEFGWRQHEVPPIQIEAAAHIEALEAALREARSSITAIAAECHRAKWEFDLSEDYTPSKAAARASILQAFNVLHRIGDIAIKAKDAAEQNK